MFIGDSITAAWGVVRAETFARHGFVARGVPGETSAQIRARFLRDTADARGVHLLCGINDIAEIGGPVPDRAIAQNIIAMGRMAFAAGLPLTIGTVMPSDFWGWRPELRPVARIRTLNGWLRGYSAAGTTPIGVSGRCSGSTSRSAHSSSGRTARRRRTCTTQGMRSNR